jgi:hypothetical protein
LTNNAKYGIIRQKKNKGVTTMHIYDYRHAVPEGAIFLKSEATGQIYAMTCMPPFGGFTEVTREEYDSYVREHHLR